MLPPLLVAAERVAVTVAQGVHGRRRVGQGETFWQFRQYEPGDAATRIDWRESAKSQRLYVRETEWEAAQSVWLWRDASASMDYYLGRLHSRGRVADKARPRRAAARRAGEPARARRRAPDPARQRHRADERTDCAVAGRRADRPRPGRRGRACPAFEPLPRAGQLVLIGDFLSPLDAVNSAVARFAAAGLKGHLLQVVDPAEEDLPFDGRVRFEGVEERDEVVISRVESVRERLFRAVPASSRGTRRDRRSRSAGASAFTAPTARRTSPCWRSTRRCRPTGGGERWLARPSPASLRSAPSPAVRERGYDVSLSKPLSRNAGEGGPSPSGLGG